MTTTLRRSLATAALIALVAIVAASTIGIARATAAVQPAAVSAVSAPSAEAGATGIDADLDAVLAADERLAATAGAAAPRGELRRLAAWRKLVHATVLVDLKQGGLTTVQLDHGTISAVSPTSLTIGEAGGGSVTVALGNETRVRRDGSRAEIAALKAADEVFVMSKVEAAGTTAYLVIVPRK